MLLTKVLPCIQKKTHLREAISPKRRLIATMRYLATGRSIEDIKFSMRIFPQLLRKIIMENCAAIIKALNNYTQVTAHLL